MVDVKYVVALDEEGAVRRIDMAKEKFTWLAADTFTRSRDGKGGQHLEQSKTYEVNVFGPDIVEEWVRSGAAEYAVEKKAAKETK